LLSIGCTIAIGLVLPVSRRGRRKWNMFHSRAKPMRDPEEVEGELTGPGGPFETRTERVLGETMRVFSKRARHLRAVLEASSRHGDADYLVFDGGLRLSYREHLRAVGSVAKALRERFGIGKGDRVAILAANAPEWIVTFWATVSLGAIAVGLNAWWAGEEIRRALDDCTPKLLVVDRKRRARIDHATVARLGLPVVEIERDFAALWSHDLEAALPHAPIDEDDPASILYTSGTTGTAKGVVSTHRNVIALCMVQIFHGMRMHLIDPPEDAYLARLPKQRCALVANPLFHVSGLYTQVVTFLMTGSKTVWTTGRFDPVRVMQLIEKERVTGWSPHGSMGPRLVNHPDVARHDLSTVCSLGSGGAPVPASLQARLCEVFPAVRSTLTVGYGLTECTALATIQFGAGLAEHPGSVGRPLPTIQIELRDAGGSVVEEGREGEIHVRSPLVMKEYWQNPEATAASILPGRWLRTGDVGRIENGLLYIHSRRRDMILRGAENVHPSEIELRLEQHTAVKEAAVIGVEHPELGEEVKAIVVLQGDVSTDALAEWVRATLAYFKVPTKWALRTEPLPRNASGKVLKHVLRDDGESPFVLDE
jgi:long-chain acyl-CoA synthetase